MTLGIIEERKDDLEGWWGGKTSLEDGRRTRRNTRGGG